MENFGFASSEQYRKLCYYLFTKKPLSNNTTVFEFKRLMLFCNTRRRCRDLRCALADVHSWVRCVNLEAVKLYIFIRAYSRLPRKLCEENLLNWSEGAGFSEMINFFTASVRRVCNESRLSLEIAGEKHVNFILFQSSM